MILCCSFSLANSDSLSHSYLSICFSYWLMTFYSFCFFFLSYIWTAKIALRSLSFSFCCCFFNSSACYCFFIYLRFSSANKAYSMKIGKIGTLVLLLELVLFLDHLDISFICHSEGLEILIDFSQLICILFKSLFEFAVDLLNSRRLFFLLQLFDSLGHSLSLLLGSFLHIDNFLLILIVLGFKQSC